MEKYFVFHDDDYADNGGFGFVTADTLPEALQFIEKRLAMNHARGPCKLTDYTLIKGKTVDVVAISTVTKIAAVT